MNTKQIYLSRGFKYVAVAIIFTLLGLGVGFVLGVEATVVKVANVASSFVNISIDENLVKQAIFQYNNKIKGCFPSNLSV